MYCNVKMPFLLQNVFIFCKLVFFQYKHREEAIQRRFHRPVWKKTCSSVLASVTDLPSPLWTSVSSIHKID